MMKPYLSRLHRCWGNPSPAGAHLDVCLEQTSGMHLRTLSVGLPPSARNWARRAANSEKAIRALRAIGADSAAVPGAVFLA